MISFFRRRKPLIVLLLFALTACLYLLRLEMHTRADIFFPTDYSAALAPDLSEAVYQEYVDQPGRPYTIRQDMLLSRLAYIRPPEDFSLSGATVGGLCDAIESAIADPALDPLPLYGRNRDEIEGVIAGIREQALLCELSIIDYINNASGLAGYVFEHDAALTITLRGTDDLMDGFDNALLLPFNVSLQYADVLELLQKFADAERIWLTGHSKGGHNAIYAASIDPRCFATGFNAPGFGIFLSNAQHDGLDRGVNFVMNGDVTGFLLFHLERRVVLESTTNQLPIGFSLNGRHRMNHFFSVDDLMVSQKIYPLSAASEWITQIIWLLLLFVIVFGAYTLARRLVRSSWRRDH